MLHSTPQLLALLGLALCFAGVARGGDDKPTTPEETFKAFAAAMKDKDVKTAMSQMTSESRSMLVGLTLMFASLSLEFSESDTSKGKARISAIKETVKSHGISDSAVRALWGSKASNQTLLEMAGRVRDKPAFVADFLKIATRVEGTSVFTVIGDAKLAEIKINGEKAKAKVISSITTGKEQPTNILNVNDHTSRGLSILELALSLFAERTSYCFKLENGVWKIDVFATLEEPLPAPPQAAAPQPAPQVIYCPPPRPRCRILRR